MIAINDLGLVTCQSGVSIREAMARLNANPYVFQVVVDRDWGVLQSPADARWPGCRSPRLIADAFHAGR